MLCLECGNCHQGAVTYFCPVKNDFVVTVTEVVKERGGSNSWRKGTPHYEQHRRQIRKDKVPQSI